MQTARMAAFLCVAVALIAVPLSLHANGEQCNIDTPVGRTWLATGTVTRVDGPVFYLLGKDNVIYKIDTSHANVMLGDSKVAHYVPRIGETIRVYGVVGEDCKIDAAQLRVFTGESEAAPSGAGPKKEVKIIVEKEPTAPCDLTCPPPCEAPWQGRGLITDVDYGAGRIIIQTSNGSYTVNVGQVSVLYGAKVISMGLLNQGDAIKVSGSLVGVNEINASSIRITRTRSEAESALPMTPVSLLGVIESIDYASFTFTMRTESSPLVVSVDNDTVIQQRMTRMAFMDLKPGTRVKMSGYGSLATGYAAQHIQIVSVAP